MSLIVERWRYRTPLNIWMLFLWFLIKEQIYYNSRTSKYKQILTNKSHRHEILKRYYRQMIAESTYTQAKVYFPTVFSLKVF